MYAVFKDGKIRKDIYIIQIPMAELAIFHRNAVGIPQVFAVDDKNLIHIWPKSIDGYTVKKVKDYANDRTT